MLTELVYRRFSRPLAKLLSKTSITPNTVTFIATAVGLVSAAVIATHEIYLGVLILLISQILDCTDGDLARLTGKTTKKGAYLDRVFDRFVDAAIVIGIVYLYPVYLWLAGFLAAVGSFGVSITRAMAEAEGAECKVGIGGRDTRLAIIMVGLVAGHTMQKEVFVYSLTLWVVAILGFITTFHRMIHTIKQL
ncbi:MULTISPECIES: CDP-alcohol phosphatidyltransferase family protein [unclassified Archaeoglobus]|uniref:CDP-alcohol phosphatidyltransferase family protein n=1 Tax=unclassified Archaeoglobus TaxID=2643606 RepID=UPI0025BC0649|nr:MULTISPECIES: CDP-alcohol phosphatidyltransferase family protein [unclassified Archaeoglobus]